MKNIALVALLLASPALAGDNPGAITPRVVREFVRNTNVADWVLDAGWTWSDGTLTHWAGTHWADDGSARQMSMPALNVGRQYRVNLTFSGRTKGSIGISLGGASFADYGESGTFSVYPEIVDPQALLTLIPTNDFDGSISSIQVVELGDEVVDQNDWTVPEGWSQDGGAFRHTSGAPSSLERAVAVVPGRTYRVHFNVDGLTVDPAIASVSAANMPCDGDGLTVGPGAIATVSLAGANPGSFTSQGNCNYSFDMVAAAGSRLAFTPQSPGETAAALDWIISTISVREILSDPVTASKNGPAASLDH